MIGGRSGWLAWPVGIVCAGVVGALVAMAAPAVPTAVTLAGDVLRAGAAASESSSVPPEPLAKIGTALTDDCRTLYPGPLWLELTWNPNVVLSQNQSPPPTAAATVLQALAPSVRMTCSWHTASGAVVSTTLADVTAPPAVAQAALQSAGFACAAVGDGIRCARTKDGVTEDHVVRDGVWVATVERGWQPPGYADEIVTRLWPDS